MISSYVILINFKWLKLSIIILLGLKCRRLRHLQKVAESSKDDLGDIRIARKQSFHCAQHTKNYMQTANFKPLIFQNVKLTLKGIP